MTDAPLPPPTRRSVWTPREKIVRLLWGTVAALPWRLLPAARPALLRLFGGRVGRGCRLAGSVSIAIPWHLRLGDGVEVGERVVLYGLGPIEIGDGCVLDYGAHLCAGTHDMRDSRFPLLKTPITLGPGCFVGLDAYVGPDVVLGPRTIVAPRASVHRSHPGDAVLVGNPARPEEPGEAGGAAT